MVCEEQRLIEIFSLFYYQAIHAIEPYSKWYSQICTISYTLYSIKFNLKDTKGQETHSNRTDIIVKSALDSISTVRRSIFKFRVDQSRDIIISFIAQVCNL